MLKKFYSQLIPFLLLIGTSLIFLLSWLPDPGLGNYKFLPDWLARWTDAQVNDNIRTAVPLLFLGYMAGCWLALKKRDFRWWLGVWFGLTAVVLIAEMGQLLLPARNFDWGDVGWGAVGALVGLGTAALSGWGLSWIKRYFKK